MPRNSACFVRCAALLLFSQFLPVTWPQAVTGSISGSVTDTSGASIASVRLTLVNAANGERRSVLTNEAGQFMISSVDPGGYSLTLQAEGFKTLVRDGMTLTPSEILSVGVLTLELGTVQERVTVTAQGAEVQTASGERSEDVTSVQTEELPVYGRVVTSLVAIEPGVVDPIGAAARTLSGGSTTDFNVLGNRIYMNNFSLDGITLTATGGAPNGTFGVSMEAVSEMKVLLSNYQAAYGRLSGSNVEIVSKSGTREFHGMGMYYMRNEDLNANNFFNNRIGSPRPVNRFNAVTYNIGGPVYYPKATREKVFFFWNQEILPSKTTGALQYSTMPTALERAGNFSQSLAGGKLIPIVDPSTGQPFPGNIVPSSRIDPNGLALLNVLPLPNITNTAVSKGVYNYDTQFVSTSPTQLDLVRVDYSIGPKDSLSVTWNGVWQDQTKGPNGGGITASWPIVNTISGNIQGMVAGTYRHIFSPTMVNEFTVGYAYTDGPIAFQANSLANLQRNTYGFNAGQLSPSNNPLNLLPGLTFGGISDAPSLTYDGRFPFYGTRYVTDIGNNLSMTWGSHTIKAGVFVERTAI